MRFAAVIVAVGSSRREKRPLPSGWFSLRNFVVMAFRGTRAPVAKRLRSFARNLESDEPGSSGRMPCLNKRTRRFARIHSGDNHSPILSSAGY